MKSTWKAVERRIAGDVGSQRTGPQGYNVPDVIDARFSYEIKHRETLPKWLHAHMKQAEENASEGTRGVLILHECGMRHNDNFVVLRWGDWLKLMYGEDNE